MPPLYSMNPDFAKFVHEQAHARPRGANHLCERLLADFRYDRLWPSLLAEICHQQKQPRQTLLARIEKLIDQVLLNAGVPRQQIRHEPLGKLWLVMEHADDRRFVEPHDGAFCHCRGCRQAQWLARQTALANEIPLPMDCDNGFLPPFGDNADLDLALLNVKDRIRRVPLQEDLFALSIRRYGPAPVHGGKKRFDIEGQLPLCFHESSSRPSGATSVC